MTKQKKPHDDGDDILSIDKYRLDEEWGNQSQLYNWYAKQAADARQRMDEAKSRFQMVEAKLRLAVMASPGDFGIAKTTEKVVEAVMITQVEYTEALSDVHNTRHQYDCLQGLLIALDHKKKALENLVSLQGRDYFSEPVAREVEDKQRLEKAKRDTVARRGVIRRKKKKWDDWDDE